MKLKILYTLLFILMINCKTETKQTIKKSENLIVKASDTIKNKSKLNIIDKFIGKIYKSIDDIDEFKQYSVGFASIEDEFNSKTYDLLTLSGKGDIEKFIIFRSSLSDGDYRGNFKILDILDLTTEDNNKLLKDKDKNLFIHFCYKNGKNDQEIIAIAEYDEYAEFLTKIHKAWRADRKTEKIIEIPTAGIKVENMDYGL